MKYCKEYWDDVRLVAGSIPGIDKLYNKKILITGATGMLCSPVVDIIAFLNREKNAGIKLTIAGRSEQRCSERFKDALESGDYEFVQYDANSASKPDVKADYIIHGASNADNKRFLKEPIETLLSNIIGLKALLDLAADNKGSRLLFVSSSEVYGNRERFSYDADGEIAEDEYGYVDILSSRSCYPSGKRAAESLCASYIDEYGVDAVIVRPGYIYGPTISASDSRASAAFTHDAAAGRDIVMKSKGDQQRSYCYMLDCASALLSVLLNGACGDAYNISNKDSIVSIRDVAECLAKESGVNVVFEIPTDAEKKSFNPMKNSVLDATKLENLGWKAHFSLDEGIKRTLKFL
ncbi:MAG: NAD-dependent epimerase/dehydratase family protein [Butyrivibrio sp.]|nr:NAD-dependent epimerase/dehydratase family protein [Butyrivibrio sp.]